MQYHNTEFNAKDCRCFLSLIQELAQRLLRLPGQLPQNTGYASAARQRCETQPSLSLPLYRHTPPDMTTPLPAALTLHEADVQWTAIRAQGPGGQNVNKVSCAIHMRFDVRASRLPEPVQTRLLALADSRITQEGVVVIKAQSYRTQEQNLWDALERLNALVSSVAVEPRKRRATKPTWGSQQRRLQSKSLRANVKAQRGKVRD